MDRLSLWDECWLVVGLVLVVLVGEGAACFSSEVKQDWGFQAEGVPTMGELPKLLQSEREESQMDHNRKHPYQLARN